MTDPGERASVLVIGYGNDLRSDDGIGRRVAERIDAYGLDGVEVRSVMQLTPELALDVVDRELVVFVDASVDTDRLRIDEVVAAPGAKVMTHHVEPAGLLAAAALFGETPTRSLLVSIPAADLDLGDRLSDRAASAAAQAVDELVVRLAEVD